MEKSIPLYSATILIYYSLSLFLRVLYSNVWRYSPMNRSIVKQYKQDANKGSIVVTDDVERDPTEPLSWPLGRGLRNSSIFVTPLNHMPA